MAIEQSNEQSKPPQPPALISKVSLTPQELQDRFWSAYRLGVAAGLRKAGHIPNPEPIMPQCPIHKIPLWSEPHPTADGSWLYCAFCRQDARSSEHRHTDSLKKIRLSHIETVNLNQKKP